MVFRQARSICKTGIAKRQSKRAGCLPRSNVRVELWTKGGLISGSKRRFSRQMDETIDGAVKKFVVDWTLDPQ